MLGIHLKSLKVVNSNRQSENKHIFKLSVYIKSEDVENSEWEKIILITIWSSRLEFSLNFF